ncbi:MAG: RNA methyltransferase [Pseudomonadales bacterium]|nr:RNA methyltransferase [Pseudomonadales bacterium]
MSTQGYREKKAYYDGLLTLFGRNPVMEALQAPDIRPVCLHLAASNRPAAVLDEMEQLARSRGAEVKRHTREALARISRNGRQDQGVAIDVEAPNYRPADSLASSSAVNRELLAVDRVTNPQNLGMIIRAVGASPLAGVIIPRQGTARIDGLVIKSSAGALFRTPVYHCEDIAPVLAALRNDGDEILGLDAHGERTIGAVPSDGRRVFVLGNETHGLSAETRKICTGLVNIPLAHGVESLNVSVTAGIIAFRSVVRDTGETL